MHDMRESERNHSRASCINVHEPQGQGSPTRSGRDLLVRLAALSSTTNPLTATALIYAFGAGITAGAGTRLVLQLLLDFGWR
jgi:hypothetical protein